MREFLIAILSFVVFGLMLWFGIVILIAMFVIGIFATVIFFARDYYLRWRNDPRYNEDYQTYHVTRIKKEMPKVKTPDADTIIDVEYQEIKGKKK